jgi:hypothetical protein
LIRVGAFLSERIFKMKDGSKAWVWERYQGVVQDGGANGSTHNQNQRAAGDRVVPFRTAKDSRSDAMGQTTPEARTRFGIAIAASVLIGAFFPLISFALFLIAVLLIASGREPQKTEEFLTGLPGGDYVIKALARVDGWLS